MTGLHSTYETQVRPRNDQSNQKFRAQCRALQLYRQGRSRAWWGKVRSVLARRSRRLLDLAAIKATCTVLDYRYVGKQMAPISQIRGSSSQARCHDFDVDFHPLKTHTQSRWLGVATSRELGKKLPPVELIQIGDVYFVKDGHHRVSVARARGEQAIEAEVTVWYVVSPSPWQQPAIAPA